jgi:hypothetical protein
VSSRRTSADKAPRRRAEAAGQIRRAALRRRIAEAFSSAAYPGDDHLAASNDPAHVECARLALALRGQRWQDVPLDVLRHHYTLSFFSPEGFRYFLPAYVLACVDAYEDAGNIPDSLVFHLVPPRPEGPELDRFLATMAGLTRDQKQAIASFIEYMIAAHGRDDPLRDWPRALRRFWADAAGG